MKMDMIYILTLSKIYESDVFQDCSSDWFRIMRASERVENCPRTFNNILVF